MEDLLPIGLKQGCLVVIGGQEEYLKEYAAERISGLEEQKQKFIRGEKTNTNFEDVETFDRFIDKYRNGILYKCRCKCGNEGFYSGTFIMRKKHRYCSEECGLKLDREKKILESYPREKSASYDIPYLHTFHETLEIVECIDDNWESEPVVQIKNRMGAGYVMLYKIYKCRCFLCGSEYEFKSSDFEIWKDYYGSKASWGYYSNAFCDCHEISSFQWRTSKILNEFKVPYRVEYSFPDLLGVSQKNLLRYDFAIFDQDKSVKCLIECQGEQHSRPVPQFGGERGYEKQVKNDEIKRNYAKELGIPLIEIPYKCKTYDDEVEFLKKEGIIDIAIT